MQNAWLNEQKVRAAARGRGLSPAGSRLVQAITAEGRVRPGQQGRPPPHVYLREDAFAAQVTRWLTGLFAPGRLEQTIDQMTAAQDAIDIHGRRDRPGESRRRWTEDGPVQGRDRRRGDLEEISTWITDAKAQRLAAEAELLRATTRSRMTRQQIADLISEVGALAASLRGAESEAAAEAYRLLGLRLTYYQD